PSRCTQRAKSMSEARVPWSQVFGNDRPVEVEIGPGRGELLLAYAAAAPSSNFFAIERAARAAAASMEKVAAGRLANRRVVGRDALRALEASRGNGGLRLPVVRTAEWIRLLAAFRRRGKREAPEPRSS